MFDKQNAVSFQEAAFLRLGPTESGTLRSRMIAVHCRLRKAHRALFLSRSGTMIAASL